MLSFLGCIGRKYLSPWIGSDGRVTGTVEQTEAHFKDLVLVEALVEDIDFRFKMVDLGQPDLKINDSRYFHALTTKLCFQPMGTR